MAKRKSSPSAAVVVGSFNQDMVWQTARFPVPGETRMGRFASGPGGKGFNQAVAAARQGVTTCFIGAIGADALGEGAQALARAEGLDARWQTVAGEATGTAAILVEHGGQNPIVVAPGANAVLAPAHVLAQRSAIEAARVLVTQHEVHPAASLRAMQIARTAGVLCLHNPAPAAGANYAALRREADLLTPNESEFAALLREEGEAVDVATVAQLADAELHALCRRLGVGSVVVTLGAAGAFVSHADPALRGDAEACYRVPAEPVSVADTTGAGDAFNGGLAAALAQDPARPFRSAVIHANRVAGLAVENHGAAAAMPRAEDVRRRFG